MKESAQLVENIKNGNEASFKELFDSYNRPLYYFVFKYLRNKEDAEEIVQEIFLKIWRDRSKLNADLSLKSFLFTIAYNSTMNALRKSAFNNQYKNMVGLTQPSSDLATEKEVNYRETLLLIEKAIDLLPPKRKQVFKMSRYEELTYQEIADQLSLSVKTVNDHMTEALKFLRKNLKEYGILMVVLFLR